MGRSRLVPARYHMPFCDLLVTSAFKNKDRRTVLSQLLHARHGVEPAKRVCVACHKRYAMLLDRRQRCPASRDRQPPFTPVRCYAPGCENAYAWRRKEVIHGPARTVLDTRRGTRALSGRVECNVQPRCRCVGGMVFFPPHSAIRYFDRPRHVAPITTIVCKMAVLREEHEEKGTSIDFICPLQ